MFDSVQNNTWLQVRLQCNIKHPIEYIIFWPTIHGSGVNEKASATLERQILLKIKENAITLNGLYNWIISEYGLKNDADLKAMQHCIKNIVSDFINRGIICIP